MIYITGDTHNTTDMNNIFGSNMKLCSIEKINKYYGKFDYVLSHIGTTKGIVSLDMYYENDENITELKRDSTVANLSL